MAYKADLQIWFRVDLILKHMETGASKTLSFIDRPNLDDSTFYYPLLNKISGCGLTVGQNGMPVVSSGSITILDAFNSYSEEMRFFDLMQEYTPVDQSISIYHACTWITDLAPAADFAICWKGTVESFSWQDGVLDLSVQSLDIKSKAIGLEIGTTNTPYSIPIKDEARGKWIPWVFGSNLDLPAVSFDNQTRYIFASGPTDLEPPYITATHSPTMYLRDDEGNYRYAAAADYYTYIAYASNGSSGSTYPTAVGGKEYAYAIGPINNVCPFVIYGAYFWFKGQNNGALSPTGQLYCKIYELSDNLSDVPVPSKMVAQAVVEKSDYYTELRSNTDFMVKFEFNAPVVCKNDGRAPLRPSYAISIQVGDYATSSTDFVYGGYTTLENWYYWKRLSSEDSAEWTKGVQAANLAYWELLVVPSLDSDAAWEDAKNGSQAVQFQVIPFSDLTTNTDLSFEMIFNAEGIRDNYTTPVITDAADTLIVRPDHVVKTLVRDYDGTDWSLSDDWDFTHFTYTDVFAATGQYYRAINGYLSQSRATLKDWLETICSETACKIIQLTSGKFAFFPWGITRSVQKVFSDEDIYQIGAFSSLDASSVINQVTLVGAKSLVSFEGSLSLDQQKWGNYGYYLDWNIANNSFAANRSTISKAIYGDRALEQLELQLISSESHAQVLANYYLSCFDHPHRTIPLVVPYWENKDLQLLDLVEVVSAYLPASGGTSLQGREATYDSEYVPAHKGHYITRAQRYTCEIVGRKIDKEKGEAPKLTLDLRVLKPFHKFEITT